MRPRGGFTITELLVVIGIIGIGSAMTVSSLITVMPKWRLQGSATDVLTQLQYARFEAVRRNRPVIVEIKNVGNVSTSGLDICVDDNRLYNGVCAGKTMLKSLVIPTSYQKVYIATAADAAGVLVPSITFGPDGVVRGGTMPITVTMANSSSPPVTVTTNFQAVVSRSGIAKSSP
jgi:type IV fimbrial biogenesis protein FimT